MKKFVKVSALCAAAVVLSGCKLHYDVAIACPSFLAHYAAVWKFDTDTYLVQTKGGLPTLVNDAGCVISREQ